jgi:hypothetical protein
MSGTKRTVRWASEAQATHCREGEAGYNASLVGTMGDTQKSQTISSQNQGIASQVACDPSNGSDEGAMGEPPVLVGESSLVRIRMLAEASPELVFTSLAHRIDLSLLRKSFRQLRKNKSTGVDKITAKQYAENLDENLYIAHNLLRDTIRLRVNDGGIIRLIGKWLNAGVAEGGRIIYPEKGTPQGGVISPVLSNIFLHYVLDDWYVKQVQPRMKGKCFLIRFADDFIMGFQLESDAKRMMEVLPKRFSRFKLDLHPEKTQLIPFGKPPRSGKPKGTFDFLGFTFYWGKSLKGYWVIKKQTARKRRNRFMRMLWNWCKEHRHDPLEEQHESLCSKLRGFYQYFGVRGNYKVLEVVYEYAEEAWRRWLGRRHRGGYISHKEFKKIIMSFPLPCPRIVHNV